MKNCRMVTANIFMHILIKWLLSIEARDSGVIDSVLTHFSFSYSPPPQHCKFLILRYLFHSLLDDVFISTFNVNSFWTLTIGWILGRMKYPCVTFGSLANHLHLMSTSSSPSVHWCSFFPTNLNHS